MRRCLLTLVLLTGCWDNPFSQPEPEAPAEPATAAERVVGTWQLHPVELARLPSAGTVDAVGAWLVAHPEHPEAAQVRQATEALRALRVVVTPDTLTVHGPEGEASRTWTVLQAIDAQTVHVETRDEQARIERIEARFEGDALVLEPMREGSAPLRLVRVP